MPHHIKCAKCGRLLAATSKAAKVKKIIHSDTAVRYEYSPKGTLAWAVCRCGHETRIEGVEGKKKRKG
jgi:hypothetical protein